MRKIVSVLSITFLSFVHASVALAQYGDDPNRPGVDEVSNVGELLTLITNILNILIPVLISVAVVWFIVSVLQYVFRSGDEAKEKAKKNMIWGIIGIFVMVSIWGLVNLLVNTANLDTSAPEYPCITDPNTNACI